MSVDSDSYFSFLLRANESVQLYNSFESRSKIRLNRFIRERTLVKKYGFFLSLVFLL